jgi:hypothetical protein
MTNAIIGCRLDLELLRSRRFFFAHGQAAAGFFELKFKAFDLGAHLDSRRAPGRLLHRRGPRALAHTGCVGTRAAGRNRTMGSQVVSSLGHYTPLCRPLSDHGNEKRVESRVRRVSSMTRPSCRKVIALRGQRLQAAW